MCRSDGCSTDADCVGGLCGPPGLTSDVASEGGAIRQCFQADCRSNADCTELPGGVCALVASYCDRVGQPSNAFHAARMSCVYADGCTGNSDCPRGTCTVVQGLAVCLEHE